MNNYILLLLYIIFSVGGNTMIKYSANTDRVLFRLPVIDYGVTMWLILGMIMYGVSFFLYISLLMRVKLSILTPVAVGINYILLMLAARFIFHESFTMTKVFGTSAILLGVIMVLVSG